MERRIGDHIETLPSGDNLRDAEIYYYVQVAKNFSRATELYAEAGRNKNSLLQYEIYESTYADNGDFIIEFLDEHLKPQDNLAPEIAADVIKFFIGDFYNKMLSGATRE